MSTIINEWNFLADRFNTHKRGSDVHPDAAVNIHIGWPIFEQQLKAQANYMGKECLDILDFGCGTGEFCRHTYTKGHKIMGMDASEKMLEIARKNIPDEIKLQHTSEFYKLVSSGKYNEKFDAITAIHVFDWIEGIATTIRKLSKLLKKDGLFIFAVFPKKHIIDSLKIKDLFEDFDSNKDPKVGYANFDGVRVLTFVREPSYYDKLFDKIKFEKVLEYYPPYTEDFLERYKWKGSMSPEMVVLAYRKL